MKQDIPPQILSSTVVQDIEIPKSSRINQWMFNIWSYFSKPVFTIWTSIRLIYYNLFS